jgi:replicative DNA helicase
MSLEQTILKNLINNEDYCKKVLPYLKEEYFTDNIDRAIYNIIHEHVINYNTRPTVDVLSVSLDSYTKGLSDSDIGEAKKNVVSFVDNSSPPDEKWLIDKTEKFCQEQAIYGAMTVALDIMNKKNKKLEKGMIPELLSSALAISFDPYVGHDYLEMGDTRFEYYHKIEEKIPFDLEFFNKITKNGVSKKTLNIILAGTGVGKSLMMCHFAASYLNQGKNVLYITMEMAEEKISERIDANLMNINLDDIEKMPKDVFDKKLAKIKSQTNGKLIIKEYPTSNANVLTFKALLNELRLKKKFVPDVIFIDYINICSSSRYSPGQTNSYTYIKGIAEELRGLAIEYKLPIWSATQTNRTGFVSSEVGLEHTSESFGLPATADLMLSVISNEDLEKLGQYLVIQLKNRYSDFTKNKRFVIGVEKAKMRLFDVEASAQENITNSGQEKIVANSPKIGGQWSSQTKEKFKSLKVE